jgi:hypothetical protein
MKNLTRAYNQMKAMKEESLVDSSLDMHFKELNCTAWNTSKQDEYNTLYPSFRKPTDDEKDKQYQDYLDSLNDSEEAISEDDFEYSNIPIEYDYCTWVEPTNIVDGYYTPDSCTLTYEQWLNGETCPEYGTTVDVLEFKATDSAYRVYSKVQRDNAVKDIIVTTAAGNSFDGDEVSQGRIARAILGLQVLGEGATIRWVMADNSEVNVDVTELGEALLLAGTAQNSIW